MRGQWETDEGEESGSGGDEEKACRSARVEVVREGDGEDRRRWRGENDRRGARTQRRTDKGAGGRVNM